ncbi:Ribonuclease III [Bertholletia excelsa]
MDSMISLLRLLPEDEEGGERTGWEEKGPSLDEVEQILGYKFRDRRLLEQAFTHHSYAAEEGSGMESYERLEYVGDSVLNLLIAKEHFFSYPDLMPGKLTRLRAANVDKEKLARVAAKHGLHKYLRHKKPLLDGQIKEFQEAIEEYPLHSNGLIDAPKVLADMVESIIAAIFVDCDSSMDTTWEVVKNLLEPIITPSTIQTHPVTRFYELCQKHGFKVNFVDLWEESGIIEVYVDDQFIEKGIYRPKKLIALNRAASNAYNQMVKKLSVENNNNDDS